MKKTRRQRQPRPQPPSPETQPFATESRALRRHAWSIAALWALILAAYSNSFQAGFVFDSDFLILRDDRIRKLTLGNVAQILHGPYWVNLPSSGLWRPLTTISFLLNYAVLGNGEHPAGYHWLNVAMHGINVSLVYLLGLQIFEEFSCALMLAAIWGLHPLLTETVTNIAGRADLLAAFGVLAGLLCYIKATAPDTRRQASWIAGLTAAFTIGIFSKENAVVLPGLMLLYDLTYPGRAPWRTRTPSYVTLALPFAAWFFWRSKVPIHLQISFGDNPMVGAGFWTARFTAVKVIGRLLWLFLWPVRLSADYSWNAIPLFAWRIGNWQDEQALLALIACAGLLALAIRWYRHRKSFVFFLLFFFIAISPVSNLVVMIGAIMAERFAYLPSLGLVGCVVTALSAWSGKVSAKRPEPMKVAGLPAAWIAVSCICFACAVRTYARNLDWYDALSLWTATARTVPPDAKAHMNLGTALISSGRLSDAASEFQSALRLEPPENQANDMTAMFHFNLGYALARIPARFLEAIPEFEMAIRDQPDLTEAHVALGDILSQTNRLPEAVAQYRAALRIQPADVKAHNNLGSTLARMPGSIQEAIGEFDAALRIEPENASTHKNLAVALSQAGRLSDAITECEEALRIRSDPQTEDMLHQLKAVQSQAIR